MNGRQLHSTSGCTKRSRENTERPRAAAFLPVIPLYDSMGKTLRIFRNAQGRTATVLALILLILSGLVPQVRADDWKLVWSDEFKYNGPPDSKKWDYERGMVRNGEPQCYTRSPRNVRVENGYLVLEALKGKVFNGEVFNPFQKKKTLDESITHDYSSASICTKGRQSWLYGKFEIRARLPDQAGTWPAFWMLGTDFPGVTWPACGEIDIMERMWQWNGDPLSGIMTSVHFKPLRHLNLSGTSNSLHSFRVTPVKGATTGFHVYAMEWYPDRIDFIMDGLLANRVFLAEIDSITVDNPFRKPQYILLNLALNRRNRGFKDAVFPAQFLVDYVRVYQKKGAGL